MAAMLLSSGFDRIAANPCKKPKDWGSLGGNGERKDR